VNRRRVRVLAGLVLAAAAAGCGKKGPPLPPLRPDPARITQFTARAVDQHVELRLTVPPANADGTTPPIAERIEIYALGSPPRPAPGPPVPVDPAAPAQPAAPAIQPASIVQPENLVATVNLLPAPAGGPATAAPPAPGDTATTRHDIRALLASAGTGDLPTLRYVAVAAGRGRRGPVSPVAEVRLSERPAAPANLRIGYDETTLTLTWDAVEGVAAHVDELTAADLQAAATRLGSAPVAGGTFTVPATLGQSRCFVLRAVVVTGQGSVESPETRPVCRTLVDRFPPPAPSGVQAIAEFGGVALAWGGAAAPDLAGFVILRSEGPGETLQPLTRVPATARSYRDTTVRSGVTYTYAIVAVDRAVPPNESAPSDRQVVTAR
jgi:predicted small lipoprotein YifL